jgi:hypothetical protein
MVDLTLEDVPYIYLMHGNSVAALKSDVRGFQLTPESRIVYYEQVWLDR